MLRVRSSNSVLVSVESKLLTNKQIDKVSIMQVK